MGGNSGGGAPVSARAGVEKKAVSASVEIVQGGDWSPGSSRMHFFLKAFAASLLPWCISSSLYGHVVDVAAVDTAGVTGESLLRRGCHWMRQN